MFLIIHLRKKVGRADDVAGGRGAGAEPRLDTLSEFSWQIAGPDPILDGNSPWVRVGG
jgi:hypothetical protein